MKKFGKVMPKFGLIAVVLAGMTFATSTAFASIQFDVAGNTDPTNNTATWTLTYASTSDIAATVTLMVENTSNFDARITGLALNNPLSDLTSVSLNSVSGTEDDSDWSSVFSANGVSSPQSFGLFDIALITGPNLNGGDTNSGIAVGKTGTFVISLGGSGLDDKSDAQFELDFFNELSFAGVPPVKNDTAVSNVTRFQRTGDGGGGSDVGTPTSSIPNSHTPEPSSMLVWALIACCACATTRQLRIRRE